MPSCETLAATLKIRNMRLITRDSIERWANQYTAKADLPYLISRLIRATTPHTTQFDIPIGSTVFIGGWDGIVNCEVKTCYVPEGNSLWEFGTEKSPQTQAENNYRKRTKNPLGHEYTKCTFVFVTARFWKNKNKWVSKKSAEGKWAGIKVYDSSDIEQWLDGTLSVARWFSSYLGIYPFDGIMTPNEFWDEWSIGPNGLVLKPEVVTAGRENQITQLLLTLQGQACIKGIKASTKNEAIAFIIAAAKQFIINESERFFSKSLIIDTEGNFRAIRINTQNPLNLIPRFEDTQPLYAAVSKGHHVLVPLGADEYFNQEVITLPTIDRDGQVNSLIESGVIRDNAVQISKEAGRNITIVRKLLGFPFTKTKWLEKEIIREFIPALITGRWDERFIGDVEIIEKLSGLKYTSYLSTLNKWKNFEESPIIQIGETWRLTSPLDLWTSISQHLSTNDFEMIKKCFLLVFKSGNPIVEPKSEADIVTYLNKPRKYSKWLREGLTQTLILIGRYGDGLRITNLSNPQIWVDNIIYDLLKDASGDLWISIDHSLPLLAEASPTSFLKAIKYSLSNDTPEIMDLFREENGILHKTSHHTGLLWALEGLAWFSEYLRDVSLILLKLSNLDPGGNLANRPINSVLEIFKPWHYQTLASYDDRMDILRDITNKEKESGWTLLLGMLPGYNSFALQTHKMRWRMFDQNTNLNYTYKEIWETHSFVISLLIDLFDNNEIKFSELLKKIVYLSPSDRETVLDWAESVFNKVKQKKFTAWQTIREILHHHRSFTGNDRILPSIDLTRLEKLYYKLQPTDVINKHIWLFNDQWPIFIEGFKELANGYEKRHEQQQIKIDEARQKAATIFIKKLGIKKTVELRKKVKEPWTLGDTLAKIITKQEDVLIVCDCLHDNKENLKFIHSFMFRKAEVEGFEWIKNLLNTLIIKKFSTIALSNILIPITHSQQLWEFIRSLDVVIQNEYWLNTYPRFYQVSTPEKVFGVEMLIKYKRFFSAIDVCYHFPDEIPTKILIELLTKTATEQANEQLNYNLYSIETIFETLEKRSDIEKSSMIALEWLYLSVLGIHGTRRSSSFLEEELSNNPEFFIDILKCVYVSKDDHILEEEHKGLSKEIIQNRAQSAFRLLHSWKRIPGVQKDYSINEVELQDWITKVRKLAEESKRLEVADMQIGHILAQYPENVPHWPQEIIFRIIEEINTDSLKSNYSSAMYNKRSFSTRGPFDGGNIEREKADYFSKLAQDVKNKYPNVAEIFRKMEHWYLSDAKRMDETAERDKLEY
jgi:hypothetical protein